MGMTDAPFKEAVVYFVHGVPPNYRMSARLPAARVDSNPRELTIMLTEDNGNITEVPWTNIAAITWVPVKDDEEEKGEVAELPRL